MALYMIGQVSKLLSLPIRTIRYYETIGLVTPHYTDPETNYRYYSLQDMFRLDLIRCLGKATGLPLKTIKEYVAHGNDPEMLTTFLKQQSAEIDSEIDELNKRKEFLTKKLHAITLREDLVTYQPAVEERGERRIYVKPDSAADIEQALIKARASIVDAGNHYDFTYYLLRDIDPSTLEFTSPGRIHVGTGEDAGAPYAEFVLPRGRYVCVVYQNRDNGRARAIEKLVDYIQREDLRITGKMIFWGSLVDITSISGDDYFLSLEIRIE
ncbi:MAG: MerR family transcriptional regulator [Coriobacteriales bacterium]|jgi:DNA-binding transcriptional MerR regulator|nr:MerR family transcriptional regulator [Coriobacteriales bacterium]